jgi:Tetratricopeptide repeat
MSMNNLASVLRGQGKCKRAEEMHRRALELKETLLARECSEIKNPPGVPALCALIPLGSTDVRRLW